MTITRRTALGLFASALVPGTLRAADLEPDFLRALVDGGTLPPLAQRLPLKPRVINVAALGGQPGQYGGTLRTVIGSDKDIRLMTIYGYRASSATTRR